MGWYGEPPQRIQEQLDISNFGDNTTSSPPALLIKHDTPEGQDVQRFEGEEWEIEFWNEQLRSVLGYNFPSEEAQADIFRQIIKASANSLDEGDRFWLD